jgi:integrase
VAVAEEKGSTMSEAVWKKITGVEGKRQPKPFLEIKEGKYKTSYRVRFNQDGIHLYKKLEGDFSRDDWKGAEKEAERLIYEARFGKKPRDTKEIRTLDLCDEIVGLRKPGGIATFRLTDGVFRNHIKPFLSGVCPFVDLEELEACPYPSYLEEAACPYGADLNLTHFLSYKAHFRMHRPKGTFSNHFKFFNMLFIHAFEKGLLERRVKLPFDVKKEDFRKRGLIIPDDDFRNMIASAGRTWRDRMILGRFTGQRPSVIRTLRKNQVDFKTGVVQVEKEDSKNRNEYAFVLPAPALEVLRARNALDHVRESTHFFPMKANPFRPMDDTLGGWNAAKAMAAISADYTPHDLRHTYLTEKFKNARNPALVCYACDLSLAEATKTYIHFSTEDTQSLARETSNELGDLLKVEAEAAV